MANRYFLVLDIGTTGVKGLVFDQKYNVITKSYLKLNKTVSGAKVEQNPTEILRKSLIVLKQAVKNSAIKPSQFHSFGITNQRETIVAWHKTTGAPAGPAIVWEDSRTKNWCATQKAAHGTKIQQKTGLHLEPYFSGSKMAWLLQNSPKVKQLAQRNKLLFGTLDSWIIWNLNPKHPHVTDITNASRTLLLNVKTLKWDKELLDIFQVNKSWLPKVLHSRSNYGELDSKILGFPLPIRAVCGDQQSSTFAAGVKTGNTKVTFGTGTFVAQVLPKFKTYTNFYTTVVPKKIGHSYIVEAKIEKSAEQVSKYLKYPKKLKPILIKLAQQTSELLAKLPTKPKTILIDGGISQSNVLFELLKQDKIGTFKRQVTYDGTALGIAKLLN